MSSHTIGIQIAGLGRIEDHHAHLLRLHYLDRCLHFASGNDDRAIDAHCLRLMSQRAILVAAYIDGTQRAGVEIIPDRNAQREPLSDHQTLKISAGELELLDRAAVGAGARKYGYRRDDLIRIIDAMD